MARPRQFSDEEMIEAARSCFLEQGPGVATAAIAELAGVSQAALFKRFGTKEELMLSALLPTQKPEVLGMLQAGPGERPLAAQLAEIATGLTRFFARLVPGFAVLRASGISPEAIHKRFEKSPPELLLESLTRWFEAAEQRQLIRPGDARHRALQLLGGLHIQPFLAHLTRAPAVQGDLDEYIGDLVTTMCQGMMPLRADP